jgi:chemotaxis signal transduction protein
MIILKDIGFAVDEVEQIMFLEEEYIKPAPHSSQSEWIRGVYHHDKTITLLHVESLLKHVELQTCRPSPNSSQEGAAQ